MSKAKKTGRLPSSSVRARAEALLERTSKPYDEIVADILKVFPEGKTSTKSVAWYASRMRAAGKKLPERPRVVAAA